MHERAQVKHVAGVVGRTHLERGVQPLPNGVPMVKFLRGKKVPGGLALAPENCPEVGAKPRTDPTPSSIQANT
jgi:hypothetical protein